MPRKSPRAQLLELARKRFELCQDADKHQLERELEDLKFYAGDQWPSDIRDARKGQPANAQLGLPPVPARPCITINKTREPVWQVLNQERQSDIGIELDAADDFGDILPQVDETEIELREGLYRRIQRALEAVDARTWGFTRATIAGRGYWGVMTRYVPGKTFDQEVYIHRFYNQQSVSLDPMHEQPDGSDAEYGFVGVDMPWEEYKAEFPKVAGRRNYVASCSDSEFRTLGDEAPGWFATTGELRTVRVVDYWYTERQTRTLVQLVDGSSAFEDELPDNAQIAVDGDGNDITRTVVEKQIKWCKLDGKNDEPLDETDWPGPDIPIIKVLGEELQPYDKERRAEGMVRPMRGSAEGNNAMVSKLVEQVGLAPIPPFQATPKQVENFEQWYQLSTTRALPYLPFNPDPDNPGPPVRSNVATPIEAIGAALQVFNEGLQSTSRVHDPTLGKVDPSLKSGKALNVLNAQSEQGVSNYFDNFTRSLRYEAQIVNNLMYPIYGSKPGRLVRILTGQGQSQMVRVNQPAQSNGQPMQPSQNIKSLTLTKDAKFNVLVKVTKSFESRRDQEASIIGHLLMVNPALLTWFGDLFFQNQDGPGHQQMAARAKVMLDPKIQAMLNASGGNGNVPPQVQQQMMQLQQQLQDAEKLLAQAHQEIQSHQVEMQSKEKIAFAQIQSEEKRADIESRRRAETAIAVAEINKRADVFVAERDRIGVQTTQAADQMQERVIQARDQAHDAAMSVMEHGQTLQQNDQEHQQAMAQTAQSATLQPTPEQAPDATPDQGDAQ